METSITKNSGINNLKSNLLKHRWSPFFNLTGAIL